MDDHNAEGGVTQPEHRQARPGMADGELCIIIVERSGMMYAQLVSQDGVVKHPQYANPNEAHYPGLAEDFLTLPLSDMPYGFFVDGEGTARSIAQAPAVLTYNPRTHTLCVPWQGCEGAAARLYSPMLKSIAECLLYGATIAPPESFPLSSLKLPDAIRVANEHLRCKFDCSADGGVALPLARHLLVESSLQLTRCDEGKVFVITSGTRSLESKRFYYTPEIEHWSVLERYGVVRLPCGLKTAEIDALGAPPHIWVCLGDLHHDGDRPDGVQTAHNLPVLFAQVKGALSRKPVLR